jgi:anti-anti-sigma regulatory factor
MQVTENGDVVTVTITEQCGGLWKIIEPYLSAGKKGFVIDLAPMNFLNSISIAAIITARNKASAAGAKVAIANLGESIRSIFRVLKLERIFNLDLDLAGASQAVR